MYSDLEPRSKSIPRFINLTAVIRPSLESHLRSRKFASDSGTDPGLKDGVPAGIVKDALIALEAQQAELRARLDRSVQPPPSLHPNMADLYRER
jgi:hypothetical protein